MSNIYIQEPPTSAKVLLKTSVGDIDIELWSKEAPKTCKQFIQLCMDGYYDNTTFDRLVKGFIVQGGFSEQSNDFQEDIRTFNEFHSRLRFSRRGLLAMADEGGNDTAGQFFFTLGATPELQNKHSLFGKVTGDTIYNMLKLEETSVVDGDKPIRAHKILNVEILNNPFTDIIPRKKVLEIVEEEAKKKPKVKGVKNFGLLSFGDEAELDEQETLTFTGSSSTQIKSQKVPMESVGKTVDPEPSISDEEERLRELEKNTVSIRKKLEKNEKKEKKIIIEEDDIPDYDLHDDRKRRKEEEVKKIRDEIKNFKKQCIDEKKNKETVREIETLKKDTKKVIMKDYLTVNEKYDQLKKTMPKKGASREEQTLALLNKFKSKLNTIKDEDTEKVERKIEEEVDDNELTDDWMMHELRFEDGKEAKLAKDASTKEDDWYDVYDPRNPLNKRKRGMTSEQTKTKR